MIIINCAGYGEKTYVISIGTGTTWVEKFQVAAHNETEAKNIVADYLESNKLEGLYCTRQLVEAMASGHKFICADDFAECNNFTRCGNNGIYIEIVGIEEV